MKANNMNKKIIDLLSSAKDKMGEEWFKEIMTALGYLDFSSYLLEVNNENNKRSQVRNS